MAHLVPASTRIAAMYGDIACCVFGLDWDVTSEDTKQRLIHGSKQTENGNRVPYSGSKHFVSNKRRLMAQGEYYDRTGCLMIIPVMSLAEVLGWNGKGYQTVVMVGTTEDHEDAAEAFISLQIVDEYALASTENINAARRLLNQVVRGLAYSSTRDRDYENDVPSLPEKVWKYCKKEWKNIRDTGLPEGVTVAEALHRVGNDFKVPLVTFAGQGDEQKGDKDQHIAPDPLLLTVKAAVNWSRLAKQKIISAE